MLGCNDVVNQKVQHAILNLRVVIYWCEIITVDYILHEVKFHHSSTQIICLQPVITKRSRNYHENRTKRSAKSTFRLAVDDWSAHCIAESSNERRKIKSERNRHSRCSDARPPRRRGWALRPPYLFSGNRTSNPKCRGPGTCLSPWPP